MTDIDSITPRLVALFYRFADLRGLQVRAWTVPQWQAFCTGIQTYPGRRWVVERIIPAAFQPRVIGHLKTVRAIKHRQKVRRESR